MSDNSHNELMVAQEQKSTEYLKQAFVAVTTFHLVPMKDGNQWYFLLGEDLQSGVAGFGDTPYAAMIDFNKNYGA